VSFVGFVFVLIASPPEFDFHRTEIVRRWSAGRGVGLVRFEDVEPLDGFEVAATPRLRWW
jgi:hypothetical protein